MIPFGDLSREYQELSEELNSAIEGVLQKGHFILGESLERFESEFASYISAGSYAIGVGSGTEALHLALMASGVAHGDYVITVSNTAVPTVSAISAAGAVPLLADIDPDSYNIDPVQLQDIVVREKNRLGKKLKAIIPVHLYGQSADMEPILSIAATNGLTVIEDACQAHGAEYYGNKVGCMGDFAAFSFYPSKNLGAYGDGGIVITKDLSEAQNLRMLRNYGQEKRYYNKIRGINSRLDEIQAAILTVKLKYLDKWNDRRRDIADFYKKNIINPLVTLPSEMVYGKHAFHLYVIRLSNRDAFQRYLDKQGVTTLVHYPVPIHLQEAYGDLGYLPGAFPIAEQAAKEIISLPVFPQLRDDELTTIVNAINEYDESAS